MKTRQHLMGIVLAGVLALGSIGIVGAQDAAETLTAITFNDNTITVDGDGATVADNTVTITSTGTFSLSGTLTDGQVIVDTQDTGAVSLVLDGVDISSSVNAPIYVRSAESAALVLAERTENVISSSAASSDDADFNAVIYSTDLSIEGSGSLTVDAGELDAFVGMNLTINENPIITIEGAGDAFNFDNDAIVNGGTITADVDGKGFNILYNLTINDGTITLLNSDEGLEAGFITINDGSIWINAADDGINISEPDDIPAPDLYFLYINGGTVVVNADGDGIDSNGSIEMTGGVVIVNGPTANDNGALDYDGTFNLTGGLLVAAGSGGMAAAPGQSSTQSSVMINFDQSLTAGTLVRIETSDGEAVLTFAPAKDFQSIVFSSPDLVEGTTYTVSYGGSSDGTETDGLYEDGSYTGGTLQGEFTVSGAVTTLGNVQGPRGGGRPPR